MDNPLSSADAEITRRHLASLQLVFELVDRAHLHDVIMERVSRVAEHVSRTVGLLSLAPAARITMPYTPPEQHYPLPPPRGSQDRVEHQRIGEALLTDDGRITKTPEAETIAIQALAQRMGSSTPSTR